MTAFRYRAARLDGQILGGTLDAASSDAVLHAIAERGLFPVSITTETPTAGNPVAGSGLELATTLAGLAALLEAGLPVDRALAAASEAAPSSLRDALAAAGDRVREGASLSVALEDARAVPALVLGYLKAGEKSGRLAAAVSRAGEELERTAELRGRVRAALTYPAFLALAGGVSVFAIVGFVVPRFASILDAGGRELPATTRALMLLSDVASRYAVPAAVAALVGSLLVWRWSATTAGQHAMHRWLLRLPVVGPLRLRLASARACGTLGSLLEAGVSVLPALDMARGAAGDSALAERFALARQDVDRGERLSASLERHEALSPLALKLLAFGERSGRLPAFLAQAARLEAATAQRTIQRLVTMLEPMLILGFGLVVAFVAAALLQAVYSVRPGGF